jgi:ATP-dependent Clp protease ATP-binding subunit ClpA
VFERYTDRSRRSVALAQEHARMLGHAEIDSGHLLIGLAAEGDSVACRALRALEFDVDTACEAMAPLLEHHDPAPVSHIPFTSRCKRDVEGALREALSMSHNFIGTEHLLLGLLREDGSSATHILAFFGITPEAVRAKVMELLEGYRKPAVPTTDEAPGKPFEWPDWLAAVNSDRKKLALIMGAVRRCYAECDGSGEPATTGPHLSTSMAERFIERLLPGGAS